MERQAHHTATLLNILKTMNSPCHKVAPQQLPCAFPPLPTRHGITSHFTWCVALVVRHIEHLTASAQELLASQLQHVFASKMEWRPAINTISDVNHALALWGFKQQADHPRSRLNKHILL